MRCLITKATSIYYYLCVNGILFPMNKNWGILGGFGVYIWLAYSINKTLSITITLCYDLVSNLSSKIFILDFATADGISFSQTHLVIINF